jgi:hypothetical protein
MYASGPQPHDEDDPLDIHAEGTRAISMAGVLALERLVLSSPPIAGVVLRYGHLYGPGTGAEVAGEGRGCTSMRLPRPPCSRSRRAAVASSTSPSRAAN